MKLTPITSITEQDIGRTIINKDGFVIKVLTTDKGGVLNCHKDTNPTILDIHNNMTGFYLDNLELIHHDKNGPLSFNVDTNEWSKNALRDSEIVVMDCGRLALVKFGSSVDLVLIMANRDNLYVNNMLAFEVSITGQSFEPNSLMSVQFRTKGVEL